MIQTIKKAWAIPELRKKIVFTALILLIFRIGNAIPVPYVDTKLLGDYLSQMSTTVLGLYDVMSGGAFASATVFALGVQPYINSSIIIQLLTIAIPPLERLAREGGEEGKKKIQSITRYATVAIAILQGWGYYALMKNASILTNTGVWAALVIIISFIAGSSFVMWMGEQVTEFGIGNGISIILFAGILSRVPSMVSGMSISLKSGAMQWWHALLVVIGILALIVLITWVNGAERRIPVQYAKRQVGRKMYGGQASTLPMKVNMSGVLPIIFAQSIAMIIPTVAAFLPKPEEGTFAYTLVNAVDSKSVLYMIVYFLMIIAFSYFYATIQFNPVEISNNLKKNGGFIPGFRPGKPTADFIKKVLNKVTLFGAIYLGVVAILPLLIGKIVNVSSLSIGGTSVIIVVGVALETVKALAGYVDIWLADYKYASPALAKELSAAQDYPQVAHAAIRQMLLQTGAPVYDADGYLQKGVIVRHLALPGHSDDSLAVLQRLADLRQETGVSFVPSLMSQFTPFYRAAEHGLGRRITTYEYRKVVDRAIALGLTDGYMQEKSSAREEYTPPFDLEGV